MAFSAARKDCRGTGIGRRMGLGSCVRRWGSRRRRRVEGIRWLLLRWVLPFRGGEGAKGVGDYELVYV